MIKNLTDNELEYFGFLYLLQFQKYVVQSHPFGYEEDEATRYEIIMPQDVGQKVEGCHNFLSDFREQLKLLFPDHKISKLDMRAVHLPRSDSNTKGIWNLSFIVTQKYLPARFVIQRELGIVPDPPEADRTQIPNQIVIAIDTTLQGSCK